jgi:shikimate dehydrogenase
MKKYFVIGNPIEHSLSPKLHNYWLRENNIDAFYDKKKINEEDIKIIISEIKEQKVSGINITIPYKNSVIPFLDELSPEADKTQSVNTIYLNNNKIVGHNTDIAGFELALKYAKYDVVNKDILILGAGGVVPSIIFALQKMKISKITVSNRTRKKAENLKSLFKNLNIINWGEVSSFDMIINATSIGLNKEEEIKLDYSKIGPNKLFYDVIYNPTETNFLKKAKASGNRTENGKMMFIYQAHQAFTIWHKLMPKIDDEVIKLVE